VYSFNYIFNVQEEVFNTRIHKIVVLSTDIVTIVGEGFQMLVFAAELQDAAVFLVLVLDMLVVRVANSPMRWALLARGRS
jgi:hypothetical protein